MGYALLGWAMLAAGYGAWSQSQSQGEAGEEQKQMFEREFEEKRKPATFLRAPQFPETEEARRTWWSMLRKWGQQPGFGAIAPNWQDIWEQARKRVSGYWQGTATGPGVMDRIRASVARRGVEESPAFGVLATRAGAEESGQLRDIATTMATTEAEFGERGRRNWIQDIMQMANLQVPGVWDKYGGMAVSPPSYGGGVGLGDVGSGLFDLAANYYQQKWLEGERTKGRSWLTDLYRGDRGGGGGWGGGLEYPSRTPSSLSSGGVTAEELFGGTSF